MNWGYKLMIVFIAFGSFMGFMVYNCIKTPVSLVSADYYKDELNYQQVIEGTERSNSLSTQVTISQTNDYIQLVLPAEMKGSLTQGSILFYCVSDGKKDKIFQLAADDKGVQLFKKDVFSKGNYVAKVNWMANNVAYYSEKQFNIQ